MSSASTGVYIFAYSIFYFFTNLQVGLLFEFCTVETADVCVDCPGALSCDGVVVFRIHVCHLVRHVPVDRLYWRHFFVVVLLQDLRFDQGGLSAVGHLPGLIKVRLSFMQLQPFLLVK